jgi:lipopolysaccharide transport system permease protein
MLVQGIRNTGNYLLEVWSYRHFWLSLVKADLQRRYRRSALGLGWSLLQPLTMTVVLALVYSQLLRMSWQTYGPLILTGFAFWAYIQGCVVQGCNSLTGAEAYLRQQPLPAAVFPLRTVLTIGFHFLISLLLAVIFAWTSSKWPAPNDPHALVGPNNPLALLSLVPSLGIFLLYGWAAAILVALSHVYFPDSQHLAELVLQALFFLTPIMYPAKMLQARGVGWLVDFNPLAHLLDLIRQPLLDGQMPSLHCYAVSIGFVLVLSCCAIWALSRLERRLIFSL